MDFVIVQYFSCIHIGYGILYFINWPGNISIHNLINTQMELTESKLAAPEPVVHWANFSIMVSIHFRLFLYLRLCLVYLDPLNHFVYISSHGMSSWTFISPILRNIIRVCCICPGPMTSRCGSAFHDNKFYVDFRFGSINL